MVHPFFHIFKGVAVNYRVSQDDTSSTFVISLSDVFEPLLTCSVPDLHFVFFLVDHYGLYLKIYSDSSYVRVFEMVLAEPGNEVSFTHATVSNNNYLDHEIELFDFLGMFHLYSLLLIKS